MSSLKDRFENYSINPEPKTWEKLEQSLDKKRALHRRIVTTSAICASVTVIAAFLWIANLGNNNVEQIAQQHPIIVETPDETAIYDNNLVKEDNTVSIDLQSNGTASNKNPRQMLTTGQSENAIATTEQSSEAVDATATSNPYTNKTTSNEATVKENQTTSPQHTSQTKQAQSISSQNTLTSEESASYMPQNETIEETISEEQTTNTETSPKASVTESILWIPNVFSPDDPNDENVRKFRPYPTNDAAILSYEIFIFSRGGRQVFHTKDINQAWDGTYKGHAQPMGTYIYIIQINDAQKGLQHLKGTITLIR